MSAHDVLIGRQSLPGLLVVPQGADGLIIFAHGSGSSRFSPRNVHAAERLQQLGFATLLFDLLTPSESADRRNVFDIGLLGERVVEAIDWARADARLSLLPIGLFGASTGAGAAIVAAYLRPHEVAAIVSRGGRPDLAGRALEHVQAPVLLIVGEEDRDVIALNESARAWISSATKLVTIPGAGHLFEEQGTLDKALTLAGDWFHQHMQGGAYDRAAVR